MDYKEKAKAKAKELIYRYMVNPISINKLNMDTKEARKCALIAVDEIIIALHDYYLENGGTLKFIKYWKQVREELRNYETT